MRASDQVVKCTHRRSEQAKEANNERRLAEFRRRRALGQCVLCPRDRIRKADIGPDGRPKTACRSCGEVRVAKNASCRLRKAEPILDARAKLADAARAAAFATLRVARGLSYERLARELGMSAAGVREWRRGTRIPPRHWAKLSELLGFDFANPRL